MFSPMPQVLVQIRMGVERTLGCDLASIVCLVSTRGYQWPHRDHQGAKILRGSQGNSSMIRAMTLAGLHSRFPTCLVCLWVQMLIYLRTFELEYFQDFLDLESTLICGLISYLGLETISSTRWEWSIQVPCGRVVVLFTFTIEIRSQSPWLELPCLHFLSFYLCIIMMNVYIFYDGWMYHVWWMVSFILLYFVSWIQGG